MSQETKLFKLITGEEIIGRLEDDGTDFYTLSSIRTLMASPGQNGQMHLGLIPWMVANPDDEIIIKKEHIIGEPSGNIDGELEKAYLQQTSGIQFASADNLSNLQNK